MNLVAAFYTMMTPNWHLFFVPLSVFITSLIHWNNPINGSNRQHIDIAVVIMNAIYMGFRAYGAEYMYQYYFWFAIGMLSYYNGHRYYREDTYDLSCYYHMGVHISATFANIILSSGHILPLTIFP